MSEQLDCESDRNKYSEINFVYPDQNESSGYVWMLQAPSHIWNNGWKLIAQSSLMMIEKKMERSIGLRQWKTEDIRDRNDEN